MFSSWWWRLLTLPVTFGYLALYLARRVIDQVLKPPLNWWTVSLMVTALAVVLLLLVADFLHAAFMARTRRVKGDVSCGTPAIFHDGWVAFRGFSIRDRAGTTSYGRIWCLDGQGKYLAENLEKGIRGEFYITEPGIFRPARLWAFVDKTNGVSLPPTGTPRAMHREALCLALLASSLIAAVCTVAMGIYPWFSQLTPRFLHSQISPYGTASLSLVFAYALVFGLWLAFRNLGEERAMLFLKKSGYR